MHPLVAVSIFFVALGLFFSGLGMLLWGASKLKYSEAAKAKVELKDRRYSDERRLEPRRLADAARPTAG